MTPATDTPAVVYCRVSTAKQGEKLTGLQAQEAECRRVCELRGWQVLEVIHEVQSGADDVRDGWNRACELAKTARGVVVVQDTSRISRSSSLDRIHDIYRVALEDGYAIYALDLPEIDLTEPMGEFLLGILAVVNRFQRKQTGKKTSATLRAKVARGERVGRPRVLDPKAVEMMRSLRARGVSLSRIADELNAAGHRNSAGGPWLKRHVAKACDRYEIPAPRKRATRA